MDGIPVTDSFKQPTDRLAVLAAKQAFEGKRMELLVKGDNQFKISFFPGCVLNAFKKNDLLKFQMVTNPEGVPCRVLNCPSFL